MNKRIVIAVDGHSACGKSTVSKDVAKELSLIYIDSGSMYRAVTLFCIRNDVNIEDHQQVAEALESINIQFSKTEKGQTILLNGEDVSDKIRTKEVNALVSQVAKISEVRSKLVEIQRSFAKTESIIMDGRDIGTVVFPDADVKFFLTAKLDIRTNRRYAEMQEKGIEGSLEFVQSNLQERDYIDSNRKDSPLKQADDALLIDNSELSQEDQLEYILNIIEKQIREDA
jgi:cytidylate kinase